MKRRFYIFSAFLLAAIVGVAGPKTKKVKVEYIYHLSANVSQEEAREIALQRAQAQAIADEFGSLVTQSSRIYVETDEENSNTDFLSIGGSELKGEWIETTEEPKFEFITDGNEIALKVRVSGVIREIEGTKVAFEAKILRNGTSDSSESDNYISGDDLYLAFKSPTSGYLAVYLIDADKQAFCLVPYGRQEDGFFTIKANERYIFFDPNNAKGVDKTAVDEIIVDTDKVKERNRILTIFSPNKFFKANDNQTDKELPRNLDYGEFQKWLSNLKRHDPEVSITEKAITINKE